MKEFGPVEKSILDAILASDIPWVPIQALPANGADLTNLILEGVVELWSADRYNQSLVGGPFATLTPLGCEILGMTLIEYNEVLPPHISNQAKNDPNLLDGWFPHWDHVDRSTGWGVHDNRPIHLIDLPWLRRVPLPESIIDYHPEPIILTDDDEKPIRFFAGHGSGYTATIDHRLGRRSRRTRRHR